MPEHGRSHRRQGGGDQVKSKRGKRKVAKVMGEFKRGRLHSGSRTGPKVTGRDQAIAIALSGARKQRRR